MTDWHELTHEQREIRDLAARFADEVIAPNAAEWDREHRFPAEVFKQLGELGLMGVCIPDSHGGAGADFLSYILVLEQISRGDAGVGVTLAVHTGAGTLPILTHGTPEQAERVVPPLAQGHELAAFALTESGSGSDAAAMRTRAEGDRLAAPSSGSPTARTLTSSTCSRSMGQAPAIGRSRRSSSGGVPRASASPVRRRSWG